MIKTHEIVSIRRSRLNKLYLEDFEHAIFLAAVVFTHVLGVEVASLNYFLKKTKVSASTTNSHPDKLHF